jgi:hypothetical protein
MKEFMTFVWILIFGAAFIGCTKHPALRVGDCIEQFKIDLYTGNNNLKEKLQITGVGFKAYKYKVLFDKDFTNLVGLEMSAPVEFDYFDDTYTRTNCEVLK